MAKLLFFQESALYEALGVHAIAGAARAAGHECDVLIESEEDDIYERILEIKPDLVAFSIMTRQQEWAILRLNRIKKIFPDIRILIGGTHTTMYPETLRHCHADLLCVGEGEIATAEILTRIAEGGRLDNIPNVHAKVDGRIVQNELRPLLQSWEDVAFPDRSVYRRYPFIGQLPLKRFITSFGCAYKCSFCYINNFREAYRDKGKFYRRKSYDRVIEEMRQTRAAYPMKRIHYVDDLFSLNTRWLKEFLPIYSREIGVPWSANVWIDHMDKDLVRLFRDNGCVGVTFGVESGNEETRKTLLEKPIPNAVFEENAGYLRDAGIVFHTGNIIGLPGEGVDKAYETARFNRKIGTTSSRAGLYWPFPGTRLTDYAKERGVLGSDFSPEAINSAEFINKGQYAKVNHAESDELIVMASLFQAVARWEWFDKLSQFLLKHPTNPFVKLLALIVEHSFWYSEAKFFGMLNWSGVKYYFHVRKSLWNIRTHDERPEIDDILTDAGTRVAEDMKGQRIFWSMSRRDMGRVYETSKARDGLT